MRTVLLLLVCLLAGSIWPPTAGSVGPVGASEAVVASVGNIDARLSLEVFVSVNASEKSGSPCKRCPRGGAKTLCLTAMCPPAAADAVSSLVTAPQAHAATLRPGQDRQLAQFLDGIDPPPPKS